MMSPVSSSLVEQVSRYISFTARDIAHLRATGPILEPDLPDVVERFYAAILDQPTVAASLTGGREQLARLRGHLLGWLRSLFAGTYDDAYVAQRTAIGHAHVRVGLPQHYMFAAMEFVRQELERLLRRANVERVDEVLQAVHRILTIDTALMLESYKAAYLQRTREVERASVADRLSRAEQLAEIGQLAASLAHEIKNPLAGISGAIQVLRDDLGDSDARRQILDEILRQIGRVDSAVKDLLAYARPRTPQFRRWALIDITMRVLMLVKSEPAFRKIDFQASPPPRELALEADDHQIEQLLVNLLINAAHATPAGGSVQMRIAGDPESVHIVIEDYGLGMDPETLRRAFEPFFTTKARGTGLGLPICQRIVDAHRGAISLESTPGKGTIVRIRIPRAQGGNETPEPK